MKNQQYGISKLIMVGAAVVSTAAIAFFVIKKASIKPTKSLAITKDEIISVPPSATVVVMNAVQVNVPIDLFTEVSALRKKQAETELELDKVKKELEKAKKTVEATLVHAIESRLDISAVTAKVLDIEKKVEEISPNALGIEAEELRVLNQSIRDAILIDGARIAEEAGFAELATELLGSAEQVTDSA